MAAPGKPTQEARFREFRLDLCTGELWRNEHKLVLQEKPFQILATLLERRGELITRDELKKKLWPADTFVEFDQSLNRAMSRLREALEDSAEEPRFIETLAKRGYRFIAPVEAQQVAPDVPSGNENHGNSFGSAAPATPSGLPFLPSGSVGKFLVLGVFVATGYATFALLHRSPRMAFQNFAMRQVTDSGNVALAAISPDGKYLLSVHSEKGQESLWLRNLPTNSETQVLPLSAAIYQSLAFSTDGNYIYYRKAPLNSMFAFDLYRTPVLGGGVHQVLRDIDTNVTFSPDGARMAYGLWNDPEMGKWRLISARPNGTEERVLHVAPYYPRLISVAWSPDNRRIACAIQQPGKDEGGIDMFDVAAGQLRPFARFSDKLPWYIAWTPDRSGLLMQYEGKLTPSPSPQIGFVSYPRGEFRAVTNDTNWYHEFTLSADGKILATVQERIETEIDLLPGSGRGTPASLPGIAKQMVINDVSWADNGHLLLSKDDRLVRVAADGANPVNLFEDPSAQIESAGVCGADQSLVFSSLLHGSTNAVNVWHTDADGSNRQRLTQGKSDWSPICSPDGKWVYFTDADAFQVMRVSVAGGKAEPVPGSDVPYQHIFFPIALSPDGKTLAFIFSTTSPETRETSQKLALVNLDVKPETALHVLDVGSRAAPFVQFTPDGKAVAYSLAEQGAGNLWLQPLDGSKGRQITNFTSHQIAVFHWSPDGKSLVLLRTDATHDAILLRQSEP